MATFLDITALEHFSSLFVFIFVWLVIFAILSYTKILGENVGIQIVIGLIIAILTLFSPLATKIIENIAPWIAVVFVFAIFAIIAAKMFGVSEAEELGSLKLITLIVVMLIIVVGVLSYIRGEISVPEEEGDIDYSKPSIILFHPKVMGALFILIVAIFAIVLMAGKQYV